MSEQQQQRVHFYHQDDGTSSSESRLEATHCPSMEASTSVDQLVNIPKPPGGDRMEAMCRATIPTLPAGSPAPHMDRMVAMHNATIPPPHLLAHLPHKLTEWWPYKPQPSSITDHPQQSTSTKVADSQRQLSIITGNNINQGEEPDCSCTVDFGTPNHRQLQDLLLNAVAGDMPTLDEHQALEQVELATLDVDDDCDAADVQHVQAGQYMVDMINLLEVSHHPHVGYSLQPYTGGPPYPSQQSVIEMAIPTEWYANLCLDMKELDHLIPVTVSWESFSPLLPACCHAYLQCQEDQAQFQDEVQQIPLSTFWMIDQISLFIPNWMPRLCVSMHTWPLQQLSMGDQIDEWMEEKQILGNIRREGP
ncbi:hypothetical protein EDD16DRAFT_1516010 [Pisolithus croceorrhizus]|nr:hypothetical protein EV401DRAFT_1895989 [Pisolithus croceorrhizus]KAI6128915.1 hypothetical protein EDD16DRAFT_1516010 [Pisolithus croceorrhizus]KAI6162390.1 hypothetical protein EDD17DRAFT_1508119 [Pisolithus thermaeus]